MNKRTYERPAIKVVVIFQQHQLLAGSGESHTGPSANFMSNPGIAETDDDEE